MLGQDPKSDAIVLCTVVLGRIIESSQHLKLSCCNGEISSELCFDYKAKCFIELLLNECILFQGCHNIPVPITVKYKIKHNYRYCDNSPHMIIP